MLRFFGLLLLVSLLSACVSVTFRSQDARFDRDLETDRLTLELEYHDVAAIDAKRRAVFGWGTKAGPDLGPASKFLKAVAEGRRVFILGNPFYEWDFESGAQDESLTDAERAYLAKVYVDEARVELGAEGQINVFQRIVFDDFGEALALLNAAIRRDLLAEVARGRYPVAEMNADEAACFAAVLADAEAGRDWIVWGSDGLSFELPVTSKFVLTALREVAHLDWIAELRKKLPLGDEELDGLELSLAGVRMLLDSASDFRMESERLVLIFGDDAGDLDLHFGPEFTAELEDFRPALREHLDEIEFELPAVYRRAD